MRRLALVAAAAAVLFSAGSVAQTTRISITTGGTGGVYYPLGGGMAQILSKYVPGLSATAEVTGGSVDNLKLLGSGKSEVGFTMADAAWDAYKGQDKFSNSAVQARTLMVLYPNIFHVVTVEGTGINTMQDLKGKRLSTGSPGSGTEVMSFRVLEAYGVGHSRKPDGTIDHLVITFLIDPQGRIAKIYRKVEPKTHSREVIADLKALQQAGGR